MAGRKEEFDFRSDKFDAEKFLEEADLPEDTDDDGGKKEDLEDVRTFVHSQTFSIDYKDTPGVPGPGGIPLPLTRRAPLERQFAPDQAPIPAKVKKVRNVLTRMEAATAGPLAMLSEAVKSSCVIKVYTRNDRGIRGVLTGQLLAFDKHFNLLMKECSEVFVVKRRYKRHVLDDNVADFLTVADLSVKETDDDERLALIDLPRFKALKKNPGGKAGADHRKQSCVVASGSATSGASTSKLLDQFLEASKDILVKYVPKSETPTSNTILYSSFKIPKLNKSSSASSSAKSSAGPSGVSNPSVINRSVVNRDTPGPSGSSYSSFYGSRLTSDARSSYADLQDLKRLELSRRVRQDYNPENYNDRPRRDDENVGRKRDVIYSRVEERKTDLCSESDDGSDDNEQKKVGKTVDPAGKKRRRKRKKREIRKRYVKQLLVRGENVVLISKNDKQDGTSSEDDD